MPSAYASELLIRIGADPSNAEANIQRFRQSFAGDLAGLGTEFARWSSQGSSDFARIRQAALGFGTALRQAAQAAQPLSSQMTAVDKTAQNLATHFKVSVVTVNDILNRNRQVAQLWKAELVANLVEVLNASQLLNASLVRSFLIFDSALGVNIANAVIWQRSIGEAFRKAALQAISAIAQEALVRAIYATALGFYLLAIQDYRGAALAFKSAATFGIVGGAAALAGRALAGAEAGGGEGGATAHPAATSSGGTVSSQSQIASQAAPAQNTVQVIFQGPVYGGQAGIDELVRHLSQAVTERDVNLVAYTVVRQPATRA